MGNGCFPGLGFNLEGQPAASLTLMACIRHPGYSQCAKPRTPLSKLTVHKFYKSDMAIELKKLT